MASQTRRRIRYGPGTGKFLFRIRQDHIADRYGPLIAGKAVGAVKLDLLLRAIALLPEDAGARKPGYVLHHWSYEHFHDLVRGPLEHRADRIRTDREIRHLKRKWVDNQLRKLVGLRLLRVEPIPGKRPRLIVLRDDGSGEPFDDPGAAGGRTDRYVTIRGSVITSGTLARWRAAQVAAYLSALYAEFYTERQRDRVLSADGTGRWWRQLAWFNRSDWHPLERPLLPFSKSLLENGFSVLDDQRLIRRTKISTDPRTKERFPTARVLYQNRFAILDRSVET